MPTCLSQPSPETLPPGRIAALLQPYLGAAAPPQELYDRLSVYLDLLLRWNARTNLTAIRTPEEMVRRHFGESLFAGVHLEPRLNIQTNTQPEAWAPSTPTLLDFGSGAGFPGLPIQLLHPHWRVTLAESQGKKAAFLREVVRTLGLETEVWAGRVEDLPPIAGLPRHFHAVTLRAVDKMQRALDEARRRVLPGGWLVSFSTASQPDTEEVRLPGEAPGWLRLERIQP